MKKMKKRFSLLLILASCLTLLFGALPVAAEINEEQKQQYIDSVNNFLGQVYTVEDEQLDQFAQQGAGYAVFSQVWKENREELGAFVEVETAQTHIDEKNSTDDQTVVNARVKFENHDADVIMYFNERDMVVLDTVVPAGFTNYEMTAEYTMAEMMTSAAQNMAVGLITVFGILVILIVVISLFRFIPNPDNKKSKKAKSDAKAAAVPATNDVTKAAPTAAANGMTSDTEIAAVIAAAIAAAMEEDPSADGYVVRSVRKVGTRRWKRV